jgi:hypothetical protein
MRRSTAPKTSAADRRAILIARRDELTVRANAALETPSDLIADFEAVQTVVNFAKHNDAMASQGVPVGYVIRCQEWLAPRRVAYDDAILAVAWATLPERLTTWANVRRDTVVKLSASINEAVEKGYGLMQVLSWSDSSFKAAAEHDVARSIASHVEALIEKGTFGEANHPLTPGAGFRLVEENIAQRCRQLGRDTGSSSSAISNVARDAERVAWFTIAEKDLRHSRGIW